MSTIQIRKTLFSREPVSFFGQFAVATLLIGAICTSIIKLVVGQEGGPPFPVTLSILLVAIVLALPFRWTSLVGILAFVGYLIAFYFQPFVPFHLIQPKANFIIFTSIVFLFAVFLIGLGSSILAFLQDFFLRERRTPDWFMTLLFGMVGIVIGVIAIGALS